MNFLLCLLTNSPQFPRLICKQLKRNRETTRQKLWRFGKCWWRYRYELWLFFKFHDILSNSQVDDIFYLLRFFFYCFKPSLFIILSTRVVSHVKERENVMKTIKQKPSCSNSLFGHKINDLEIEIEIFKDGVKRQQQCVTKGKFQQLFISSN